MALRNRIVCRRPDGYWLQQRLEGAAVAPEVPQGSAETVRVLPRSSSELPAASTASAEIN
jgi:hypothetical protein